MKNYSRLFVSLLIMLSFISISSLAINANSSLNLKDGNFQIVVSGHEVEPVKLAVATLSKDFEKVMHYKPEISQRADNAKGIDIVVVNESTDDLLIDKLLLRSLDGFESHRIYCDVLKRRIYIHGKDMRGTIYALYTFSEQFLEVPALWYFSSWEPQYKKQVMISSDFDYYQKSPQVRYRAWFPNDTDLFEPWRKLSKEMMNCGLRLC